VKKAAQGFVLTLQHTATPHTTTHCNTAHYNTLQHRTLQHTATPHTTTHCNTGCVRQRKALCSHCNTLQHTATHCNTLQHTATHCNTLQHTAIHRWVRQHKISCRTASVCEMWVQIPNPQSLSVSNPKASQSSTPNPPCLMSVPIYMCTDEW